jgi:hypothetical protein
MAIAKSTCTRCHEILPRNKMKQISKTEASGFSYKPSNITKSLRGYSKIKKVWVCKPCARRLLLNKFLRWFILYPSVIFVFIYITN